MSEAVLRADPFGLAPDAASYVPRPASEQALEELRAAIGRRSAVTALTGPPGIGKSMLLNVLGRQLADELASVYLPSGALDPVALCASALVVLGGPLVEDPVSEFERRAAELETRGGGVLLCIDNEKPLPLPTARWLAALAGRSRGGVRAVVALTDHRTKAQTLAALGPRVAVVRLTKPLTHAETEAYIEARLETAGVPEAVRERFDAATAASLHRVSNGVPRRLHAAAASVLRSVLIETGTEVAIDRAGSTSTSRPRPATDEEPLSKFRSELAPSDAQAREADDADDTFESELDSEPEFEADVSPEPEMLQMPLPRRIGAPPPLLQVFGAALVVALAAIAIPWLRTVAAPPSDTGPAWSLERMQTLEDAWKAAGTSEPNQPAPAPSIARPVSVQINATPWARIEVDGVDFGETPLAGIPLIEGPHRFRATLPDGRVIERDVVIDATNRHLVFGGEAP